MPADPNVAVNIDFGRKVFAVIEHLVLGLIFSWHGHIVNECGGRYV